MLEDSQDIKGDVDELVLAEPLKSEYYWVKKLYMFLTLHLGDWSSTKTRTFHHINHSPLQI